MAPPKAHEVRIKVKQFFLFYLILGLESSENSKKNRSTFYMVPPTNGILFIVKKRYKYKLLHFKKETKEYIRYNSQ